MAQARMYQLNTQAVEAKPKYVGGLKGQAKVVFDAMKAETGPVLAKDLATKCAFPGSKQDPYRVTLYYVLIFKGKGLVLTSEAPSSFEPEATPEQLEETIAAS